MTDEEQKIKNILDYWFREPEPTSSGDYMECVSPRRGFFDLSIVARQIASAISEEESDLPITPGEWSWAWVRREREDRSPHLMIVYGDDELILAEVYGDRDDDAEANAKAIGALPKLLKALRDIVRHAEKSTMEGLGQIARDALKVPERDFMRTYLISPDCIKAGLEALEAAGLKAAKL